MFSLCGSMFQKAYHQNLIGKLLDFLYVRDLKPAVPTMI